MSSTEHQQIRYAAETIYRHIQQPQYTHARYDSCKSTVKSVISIAIFSYRLVLGFLFSGVMTPARSHAQLEILNSITEDYIAGYMQDGRMSVVRRFFCLFVAFDLFFISLLWLICIMVSDVSIHLAGKLMVALITESNVSDERRYNCQRS